MRAWATSRVVRVDAAREVKVVVDHVVGRVGDHEPHDREGEEPPAHADLVGHREKRAMSE